MKYQIQHSKAFGFTSALVIGALFVSSSRAEPSHPLLPEVADATHATKKSNAFCR